MYHFPPAWPALLAAWCGLAPPALQDLLSDSNPLIAAKVDPSSVKLGVPLRFSRINFLIGLPTSDFPAQLSYDRTGVKLMILLRYQPFQQSRLLQSSGLKTGCVLHPFLAFCLKAQSFYCEEGEGLKVFCRSPPIQLQLSNSYEAPLTYSATFSPKLRLENQNKLHLEATVCFLRNLYASSLDSFSWTLYMYGCHNFL